LVIGLPGLVARTARWGLGDHGGRSIKETQHRIDCSYSSGPGVSLPLWEWELACDSFTMQPVMALSRQWYRENARTCAWQAEQSRNPLAKAAYKEMVRAWLILAAGAEQLVGRPPPYKAQRLLAA